MEVSSVFCEEGKTRIVPYENKVFPLKIEFFEEKWMENDKRRAYIAVVKFREHEVKVAECLLDCLVRRVGHVLLALTEDVEK